MTVDNDAIDAKWKQRAADRKVCEVETLSFVDLAQDGRRFEYLKQCTNGGHFNEERQELVWTFHIPAKRMHGNITSAVDHARFADEKA
jgi:hypothetical protein